MTAISFVDSTGVSAINGNNATITIPVAGQRGDYAIVAATRATSKALDPTVTTSSGLAWDSLITTAVSSYCRFGVFGRVLEFATADTQAICTGTGGSSDSVAGVIMIFRNVDYITSIDVTTTSTIGSGTAPDSPSITVASCGDAIISAIGIQFVSAPTAPSSFLNSRSINGNDTNDATAAIAWITNASTSAFNPTAWTSTSASWASATIALRRQYGHDQGFDVSVRSDGDVVREARRVVIRSY